MSRRAEIPLAASLALGAALLATSVARAEESWLVSAEAAASMIMNDPQAAQHGLGGLAAIAGFRSVAKHALLGMRLRGGLFADGGRSGVAPVDPDLSSLTTLTLLARVRPMSPDDETRTRSGLWIEAGAGGGLAGGAGRAVAEAGAGMGTRFGALKVGAFLRYLQVLQGGAGPDGADTRIGLFGIDVTFSNVKPPPPPPPETAFVLPPEPKPEAPQDRDGDGVLDAVDRCPDKAEDPDKFEDADGCPDDDNDGDGVADARDVCPDKAEVVNGVEDQDGCPDAGLIELVADRVVLDDNVLFEAERARVSTKGQGVLAAVVALWKQHPEWERLEVEGHADKRGPERFNQWLSEERATRVRNTLVRLGVPADKIVIKGFGGTRPRFKGRGDEVHARNRRVELVMIGPGSVPVGQVPADSATPPPPVGPDSERPTPTPTASEQPAPEPPFGRVKSAPAAAPPAARPPAEEPPAAPPPRRPSPEADAPAASTPPRRPPPETEEPPAASPPRRRPAPEVSEPPPAPPPKTKRRREPPPRQVTPEMIAPPPLAPQ
jgi:outer membrane protein OmpA-like peptidoglycan-associated protein